MENKAARCTPHVQNMIWQTEILKLPTFPMDACSGYKVHCDILHSFPTTYKILKKFAKIVQNIKNSSVCKIIVLSEHKRTYELFTIFLALLLTQMNKIL